MTETEFKIHNSKMTLVLTYLRHLPTLRELQAASVLPRLAKPKQVILYKKKTKNIVTDRDQ